MKVKILFSFISLVSIGYIYSSEQDPNKMLLKGASTGNIELVKNAIKQDANINFKDEYSTTALMKAVWRNHQAIVKLLLDSGANPDIQSHLGETPLIAASMNGRIEIMKLLLDKGADIDIQDNEDRTALMWAVNWNKEDAVKLLLGAGASLDLPNKDGKTVLDIAKSKKIESGKLVDSIALLIQNEPKRREKIRREVQKAIVEHSCLLPELADIVSEYSVRPKQKEI